jgi:hypothetical protein
MRLPNSFTGLVLDPSPPFHYLLYARTTGMSSILITIFTVTNKHYTFINPRPHSAYDRGTISHNLHTTQTFLTRAPFRESFWFENVFFTMKTASSRKDGALQAACEPLLQMAGEPYKLPYRSPYG